MPQQLSEKVISNLLKNCHPNHLERDLSREIAKFQKIEEERIEIERLTKEIEAWYKSKHNEIKKRTLDLQNRCSHPGAIHQPDASGGNDDSHRCDACGKVW